ncbi:hypothetical protein PO568_22240 [Enterobacter cloacae]|uniref:hypothetical protein n=1 Tax=Enterobacter cloacae TaxID=550 RepID=UPI002FFD537E
MTTFEKIIEYIKQHKFLSTMVALLTIFILALPLVLYIAKTNASLSTDPNKWATFGTYVGGVYGPIATIISVLVLIITVLEINESNKISIAEARNNNFINEIVKLTEILSNCIDKNPLINDRAYLFKWLNVQMVSNLKKSPPSDEYDIWKECIKKFTNDEFSLFENEVAIIEEILLRIHFVEDEILKARARSIFKGIMTNNERFWLECYIRRFNYPLVHFLSLWNSFSTVPQSLADTIVDKGIEDFIQELSGD